jgi:hypothetical protein
VRAERSAGAAAALLAALLIGCASGPLPKLEPPAARDVATPPVEITRERVAIALEPTTRVLSIDNPHGEIRVRVGAPGEVGIVAVLQRIGVDGVAPTIGHATKGDAVSVEVQHPLGAPPVDLASGRADHARGRADLAVFVPPGIALDLQTLDGRIQVRRAGGDVSARSIGGIVDVSAAGALRLRSERARVVARQESGHWTGESRVESDSGAILVAVPTFGDVDLEVDSGGAISVDPGLAITVQVAADGRSSARTRFGAGGQQLYVHSERGSVHLVPVLRLGTPTR